MSENGNRENRVLVWLPSPLGDAVMCTPALKAIRENMPDKRIYFFGSPMVRDVISPCRFADDWIIADVHSLRANARLLRRYGFQTSILFKNSLASALTVFLAGIPQRIGYYRDCRGIFLTGGLKPRKKDGKYEAAAMMDYYAELLTALGINTPDRRLILHTEAQALVSLERKLPQLAVENGPLVVLVPGGAFGPSKCWPAEHYADTADYLIKKYNATVVVSVSAKEKDIADEICDLSVNTLINLADTPVSLGELKAMISQADLMICNDTGPRHIAIALNRPVVTMFGPNDPKWTDSKHPLEIQIVTDEPCAPCQKPYCPKGDAKCMRNISVQSVCEAADKLLNKLRGQSV